MFSWVDLTSAAHTRLWEHINNLASAVDAARTWPKHYAVPIQVDNVANGTTIGTIVIPAQPFASRVMIRYGGSVGYGSAADFATTINASAGALTTNMAGAIVSLEAAKYGPFAYEVYLTLPTGTATTLTLLSYSSVGNSYFRGIFTAEILYAGEYA